VLCPELGNAQGAVCLLHIKGIEMCLEPGVARGAFRLLHKHGIFLHGGAQVAYCLPRQYDQWEFHMIGAGESALCFAHVYSLHM
jgi:hypothetical protein